MPSLEVAAFDPAEHHRLLNRQWLVTNGLGGYASGTLSGAVNWRYHGVLVAALPAPFGRTVMLNHLGEAVVLPDGQACQIGGEAAPGGGGRETLRPHLSTFRLEDHLPVWRYELEGVVLEKRVLMPYLQNTVHLTYTLREAPGSVTLQLRPSVHFRPFESKVSDRLPTQYDLLLQGARCEIDARDGHPPLRLLLAPTGALFHYDGGSARDIFYERDAARGYDARGRLWSPGFFAVELKPGETVTLIASVEDWVTVEALDPDAAFQTEKQRRERLRRIADPRTRQGIGADLVLAADQFVIAPQGRIRHAARAHAAGDELRSVIAGYHWFTDWGRDTMISLEGLTMTTGRLHEAAWILRTFAFYVRDGLLPNMFPEGKSEGLYHTADATLWFFHAIDRYNRATGDREMLSGLLPVLRDIIAHHLRGTRYGIGVDPADGLLRQGEAGYQLTWMDAKVEDWVVTPRRGKAVEINALWYNALRVTETWLRELGDEDGARDLAQHAARARQSFNKRFWNSREQCLFDVIDGEHGDDPAIRPNQVLAIALPHPILAEEHWAPVLRVVEDQLLTPVGLRSLSPRHPDFKACYSGDLRARDAAYHQGTVWAWLIGPFIDAWLKVHPDDRAGARRFLDGFVEHLHDGCIGSISEIFDAEAPFAERGCVAQAWSVAEVLRCFVLTADRP